jgi:DNA-binding IclR family transcriptional regulator
MAMAHTYDELKAKTIAELREIAQGISDERVQGYSQMNKDHLLPAICAALGIETHEHHAVVGLDKAGIKAKMRALKKQRDEALEAHDPDRLASVRRQLHRMNHQLRSHMR